MKSGRTRHVFWWGLAASVVLHLGLLSGAWILPPLLLQINDPPPLTARLVTKPPPSPLPVAKIKPHKSPAHIVRYVTPLPPATEPLPEPPAVEPEPLPSPPDTVLGAAGDKTPAETEAPTGADAPTAPALNPLPNRVRLEYRARIGIATGQMSLLWVNEGEHYTVTSILSPQGMASLFFSGQLVQMSRGRIIASGLQPEEFWDQRDNKRSQSRFNYATQTVLNESSKGARTFPLPAGLQDVQSLLFQLALTAPPAAESEHAVFNGKKVRSYRYRLVGEENLDTPIGVLRTLHIVRMTENSTERFEIWLAMDRYYLPVKLATEISGYEAELMVYGINSES